jgi:transcriptional regulator with XRE-family HTH domain
MNTNITLGKKLSSLRGHYRITQKEVEAKTGIKQELISKYENDERVPNNSQLEKLAILYHTTLKGIENYSPDNSIVNTFQDNSKGFFNVEKVIVSSIEEIVQNAINENPLEKGKEIKVTISFKIE